MAAKRQLNTATTTINEILTDCPLPALTITRLPNVEAMEVRNSIRSLHEVRLFILKSLCDENFVDKNRYVGSETLVFSKFSN